MAVEITPKNKRGPLEVTYGDDTFTLSGRIPPEVLVARNSVPRPKVMAGQQKTDFQNEVGVAMVGAFYDHVMPEDFKEVIDMEDLGPVFNAWAEHTGLGKSQPSGS